jgi:predicted nucleotidyltransferase
MRAPAREPLLTRVVEQLEADTRVAGAWLGGSIGRGEDDAWSDLDLHVAVYDEHLTDFWADRHALYERIGRPVLIQREMVSNAQAGGHFQLVLFDGPLEVDWNVGPLSLTRRTPWHVLLLAREDVQPLAPPKLSLDERRAQCQERLVFLWAMAPIAVKYIARGDTSRAVGQIGLVRSAVIALWRLLETGCGTVNGVNQPLEPELERILPVFGPTIDPKACLAALHQLCDRTVELHQSLADHGVPIPEDMPAQLARLAADEPGPLPYPGRRRLKQGGAASRRWIRV